MHFWVLIFFTVASTRADEPMKHTEERTRPVVEMPVPTSVTGALNADSNIRDFVRLFNRLEKRVNDGSFHSDDLEPLHKLFQIREVFYTANLDDYSSGENLYAQANQLYHRLPAKQKENYQLLFGTVAKTKLTKLLEERPLDFREQLMDLAREYRNTESGLRAHLFLGSLFLDCGQGHLAHMVLSAIENDPALPKDWKPVLQYQLATAIALSTGDEKAIQSYGVESKYEEQILAMAKKWKDEKRTMSFGARVATLKPEEHSLYQTLRSLHLDAEQRYPRSWELETARHHLAMLVPSSPPEQLHLSIRKLERFPEYFKETVPLLLTLSQNNVAQDDIGRFFDHQFSKALPILVSIFEDEKENVDRRALALHQLIRGNKKQPRMDLMPLVLKAVKSKEPAFQLATAHAMDQLSEEQQVTVALAALSNGVGLMGPSVLNALHKKKLTDEQILQLAQSIDINNSISSSFMQGPLMDRISDENLSFRNEVSSSLVKLADKWMGEPNKAFGHPTLLAITIYGRFADQVPDTVISQLSALSKEGGVLGDLAVFSLGHFGTRAKQELPRLMDSLKTGNFKAIPNSGDSAVYPSPQALGYAIGQIGKGDAPVFDALKALALTKQDSVFRRVGAIHAVWTSGEKDSTSYVMKFLQEENEGAVLAEAVRKWGADKDKTIDAIFQAVKEGKLESFSAAQFVDTVDEKALQRGYEWEGRCQGVERDRLHRFNREIRRTGSTGHE